MAKTQEQLIQYYERRLETVKSMWKISDSNTSLQNERAKEYVDNAEKQLEEVKQGRSW
jgi:hypothetical protein